ncbi:hypothetical protein AOQ84DRAFT_38265 [Glonium stellatum]|uniref:TLC domain-containing protein n=1 Tax=Glonium stellatum TaxID=574774 RepID=A0A8E2F0Z1_9PEZI|nr:hypothetical protein AOQ84DRAFT_38265 [Glonium stellatum]
MYTDIDKPHPPHLAYLRNGLVSKLAQFSGLILTIVMVMFFFVRYYLLEGFLLPRVYGHIYRNLNETNRRGFVNHHLAGAAKILLCFFTAYPFLSVSFGSANFDTPLHKHSKVTMGDTMIVSSQIFVGMYLTELLFRSKLSPVAVGHHVGAIVITQAAIAISLNAVHEQDATIEFILCFFWGAFDILAEFWPHVAIILYRVHITRHAFLIKIFRAAFFSTLVGTTVETIVVMWLFGSLWSKWTIGFKVATPILHVVFTAAQIWGSVIFYRMWQNQKRLLAEEQGDSGDKEANSGPSSSQGIVEVPIEPELRGHTSV